MSRERKKITGRPDSPSCDETQIFDTKTLKTSISELFQILKKECFIFLLIVSTDYFGSDVSEGHYNSVPSAEACQRDCQVHKDDHQEHAFEKCTYVT